ncbi:MAG: hypothetical protein LCH76_15155 [Actinobacteria bacterium]|nr:hypothetical protein [Actinomycetota bacterium]
MTTQPNPASTDHHDHRWVAAASTDEIRELMNTLARSPHAATALSELFSAARAVGAYYTWVDMDVRAADLRDSIEDKLERTLTDEEFDTLVEGAWARFAATGAPRHAYDALREELYSALWDQADTLTDPATPRPASTETGHSHPEPALWERVAPPAPPAPTTVRTDPAPGRGAAIE